MSSEFVVVAQGVEALSPKRLLNRYRYQSWDLASAAARVFLEGPQEPGMGAVVLMVREALPEDVEETTLLEFADLDDLSIYTYASKPNGAWDSTPPSGVAIVHRPSGIEVRCHSMRSAYANRSAAYCELQVRLHGWTQPEQPAGSDDAPASIGDPDQPQVAHLQYQVAKFQKALLGNTKCKECGGQALSWDTHSKSPSNIAEGRLRSHEVQCQFVLGCEHCSATVAVISADTLAERLNALRGEQ